MIERAESEPTLNELADAAGLSSFYFNRVFKRIVGVTPKQYAMAHRSRIAAKNLKTSKDVTTAIFDSGYGAASRFYESAKVRHGMTATALRKGGQGVERTVGYLDGESELFELPLDVRGTAFQELVWRSLFEIPAGHTASYGEIAARIERPKSARAVARACAANPVAVVIPCHRVVRADGDLSGYRWGIRRKRQLLDRESTK
ncbi:MAG: methylated-DNA--[protein]-cysteine S-methyltransferase [Polyangiales bacterium]